MFCLAFIGESGMKEKVDYFNIGYGLRFLFVFFILSFAMVFGVFATVNLVANTVATNYSGGEIIRGNVYLTLVNQNAESRLTSNFMGNITLLNLLKNNSGLVEGINYNCSTVGCARDYSSEGQAETLTLLSGTDSFAGFGVNEPGVSVTNAEFGVESNAQASCTPNLYVDILGDGENLMANSQSSGQSCGIRYSGCYNQQNTVEAVIVNDKEYCEEVNLPAAPAFIVGGEIRRGTGQSNLTMKLYDASNTDLVGSCILDQNNQDLEEKKCTINYASSIPKSYYVCIATSVNNNYKIGRETTAPTCGTAEGFGFANSDFDLFAETMSYSASPRFIVNDTSYMDMFGVSLSSELDSYIEGHYNRDCRNRICFLPIKLSGDNQLVRLNDARINYDSFGVPFNNEEMYKLNYASAKINGVNLSLDISKANFVIPIESTENKFKLFLDGSQLLQKNITVKRGFIFDISPKVVSFGQNVLFRAMSTSSNITSSTWNFGDGSSPQTVNGSQLTHSYTRRNSSSFEISVIARNNLGLEAAKQFRIFVGDPREIANQTIYEYKKRITNITAQINTYPEWVIPTLGGLINLNNMTSRLNSIEANYIAASTEAQFQDVMIDLVNLGVPKSIIVISSGNSIALSAGYENININYLEQIENKDVLDNSQLIEQVVGWMNDHFNPEISFRKIAIVNDFDTENLASIFTIRTNPTTPVEGKTYLILGQDVTNIGKYKTNYNSKIVSGQGVDYIELDTTSSQTFEFMIIGDVDAETLGAYIAPSLNAITSIEGPSGQCVINEICEAGEDRNSCPEDCSTRWLKFTIFGWALLIIAALAAYIILQEWYKRNYQKSLFAESNDLYNLITFIYNARRSGLDDNEIRAKLRQQKWSNEMIRFAFRKIDGKRVGMLEIPLFTRREHKETIKQISNRQGSPIDARFIKRPNY